jgi:hypothetical protein
MEESEEKRCQMPLSEDSREVEAEAEVERHIGGDDAGGEAVGARHRFGVRRHSDKLPEYGNMN